VIKLFLVRHAIAEERDAERWPDDSRRPLTADGRDRFRRAARGLRLVVPTVDRVLSSPYVRAWDTAELLREEAGWPAPEAAAALEAGSEPHQALELVREHAAGRSLALVGHEPHLSTVASLLLAGVEDAVQIELKKGGVIALSAPDRVEPGSARVSWIAPPRILRGLS